MIADVRHAAYELRFREPIVTAKGDLETRRGYLFGLRLHGSELVSEAALLPEFGTEHFEQAERDLRMETANIQCAPATSYGLDCLRWISEEEQEETIAIPVAKLLGNRASTRFCNAALNAFDSGYQSAKLKVGVQNIDSEIEILEYIHEKAPSLKLRLDANFAWRTGDIEKLCESPARDSLEWVEDPFTASSEWQALREQCGIPFANDEAFAPAQLNESDTWKNFDVLIVKPERLGPIAELERVCGRAHSEGKKVVFSSMYAGGVGLSIAAALGKKFGTADIAHGLGTSGVFEKDLLREPLAIRDGHLLVPPLKELAGLLRPEWRERLGFSAA